MEWIILIIYLIGIIPSGKLYAYLQRYSILLPSNMEIFLMTFLWPIAMPMYALCLVGEFIVECIDRYLNKFCDWIRK